MPPPGHLPNATAATEDFEFEALQEAANYRLSIREAFAPYLRGQVIEIGAGIGQMTAEFLQLPGVTRILSVEPEPGFCDRFRANQPGQELLEGVISDVHPPTGWNAIVSINVLEHIGDDEEELRQYHAKLAAERGFVCLLVPARPEIYAPIDGDFGHFRRYTKPLLTERLERAGFINPRVEYFNLAGYFAWFWAFKLRRARHFQRKQVRLFDQRIFPATQWLERKLPHLPFGQSLIAIGQA